MKKPVSPTQRLVASFGAIMLLLVSLSFVGRSEAAAQVDCAVVNCGVVVVPTIDVGLIVPPITTNPLPTATPLVFTPVTLIPVFTAVVLTPTPVPPLVTVDIFVSTSPNPAFAGDTVTVTASATTNDPSASVAIDMSVFGPGFQASGTNQVVVPSAQEGSYKVQVTATVNNEVSKNGSGGFQVLPRAEPDPTATFTPTPTTPPAPPTPTITATPSTPTPVPVPPSPTPIPVPPAPPPIPVPPSATPSFTSAPAPTPTATRRPATTTPVAATSTPLPPTATRLAVNIPTPSPTPIVTPSPVPTASTAPDICTLSLGSPSIEPAIGPPGQTAQVQGILEASPGCTPGSAVLSVDFDGSASGELSTFGPGDEVSLSFTVPEEAKPGEHNVIVRADLTELQPGSRPEEDAALASQPTTIAAIVFVVDDPCADATGDLAVSDNRSADPPTLGISLVALEGCEQLEISYRISGGGTDFATDFAPLGPDGTDSREIELTSSDESTELTVEALAQAAPAPADDSNAIETRVLARRIVAQSPAEPGSLPVVPLALGTAALVGTGAVVASRRRKKIHDPCEAERVIFDQAQRRSNAASADREAAQAVLEQEAAALEAARAEHRACMESQAAPTEGKEPATASLSHLVPFLNWKKPDLPEIDDLPLHDAPNPHAPEHPNGEQGWFRPTRLDPIDAVAVHHQLSSDLGAHDAASFHKALLSAERAHSVHMVATADGLTRLLPDEYVARHIDGWHAAQSIDDRSLGLAVVARTSEEWHAALGHAGSWLVSALDSYDIDGREITLAQMNGGASGVIRIGDPPFPSANEDADPLTEALKEKSGGRFRPLVTPVMRRDEKVDKAVAPSCEREMHRVQEAEAALAEAEGAAQHAEAHAIKTAEALFAAGTALDACTGSKSERTRRVSRPVVTATPAAQPAPQQEPQDTDQSGAYLLTHPNPNAPVRENGLGGWYHTTRNQPIQGIVVHTAEAGITATAEGVAAYFAGAPRAASAHVATDSTHALTLLPDSFTAFHAKRGNSNGLGIEICYNAAVWGTGSATYEQALLLQAAKWCGLKAALYGIPAQHLSGEEWHSGVKGFVGHGQIQPEDRSDPGPSFPWSEFLSLVEKFSLGLA